MHEVFISYSTLDKAVADAVCNKLESGGVRCWYAPRDVAPGSIWQASLMEAIQNARIFLLIYSKDYNSSSQVLNELTAAVNAGCSIVPFRIDQSIMGNAFAYYLNNVHWLDAMNPPSEQQIANLYAHICTILQKPITLKAPDVPATPKPKPKRAKFRWLVCLAAVCVLLLAFLICGLFIKNDRSILGVFSSSAQSATQEIEFLNLSLLPDNLYPYYNTAMLADEREMYVTLNPQDSTLTVARTDNGMPYLTGIENVFSNPLHVNMLMRDDRDTIYFIESTSETEYILRSYSKSAHDWVEKDGIAIPIRATEFIGETAYYSLVLFAAEDHSEEITLFIYDGDEEVDCFSKIIQFSPNKLLKTMDIRQHGLTKPLSAIQDPDHSYLLFMDCNHKLTVLDGATGDLMDFTYQQIVDTYLPLIQENVPCFSADRRYLYTVENDAVYVWDLSSGKLAFTRTFTSWFNIWFKDEHQIVLTNGADHSVSIYDLQTKQSYPVLEKSFFQDNPYFLDYPYNIVYLPELDMLGCVSAYVFDQETISSQDMFTLVDMEGNIIAASDKLDTAAGSHYANIFTHNNMLFLSLYAVNPTENTDSSIHTYLYRALFAINGDGKIEFSEKAY